MKEQLYTIPLNDAVNAGDECPFCYIERSVEQDLLDFVLGSGSSYMEADIREITDKMGFCRTHFQKMFDYGNTLGNAWILKTHYQKMIGEMKQQFANFRPGKSSLKDKFRKAASDANPIGMWIAQKEASCYICSQFQDTYARYLDTLFYLFKQDSAFREKIKTISAIYARAPMKSSPKRKKRPFMKWLCLSWRKTWNAFPATWPGWWKSLTIETVMRIGKIPRMPSSGECRS